MPLEPVLLSFNLQQSRLPESLAVDLSTMLSRSGLIATILAASITGSQAIETSFKTRPSFSRIPVSPAENGHIYPEHVLSRRQLPPDVTK
jgi:hypothetical protein